ncbi:MAG TPA: hypothetical protein VJT13_26485 [Xanthobacteraceae bacterium]|nr:hypothetical protein [Xanthobacteraceae bacterium]
MLAGLYAVVWALAWGCAAFCAQDPHHGNTELWLVPLLPIYEALRLAGAENTFWHMMGVRSYLAVYLVMLMTLLGLYAAGWLIGAIGAALYRTCKYLVRPGAPQPGA